MDALAVVEDGPGVGIKKETSFTSSSSAGSGTRKSVVFEGEHSAGFFGGLLNKLGGRKSEAIDAEDAGGADGGEDAISKEDA